MKDQIPSLSSLAVSTATVWKVIAIATTNPKGDQSTACPWTGLWPLPLAPGDAPSAGRRCRYSGSNSPAAFRPSQSSS